MRQKTCLLMAAAVSLQLARDCGDGSQQVFFYFIPTKLSKTCNLVGNIETTEL